MIKSKVIQFVVISFLIFQPLMSNNILALPTTATFEFGVTRDQSINYNVTFIDPSFDPSYDIKPTDSWHLNILDDTSAVSGIFDETGVDLINVTDARILFEWTNNTGGVMYGYNNIQGILYPVKATLANGTVLTFMDLLNLEYPGYPKAISGSQVSIDISGVLYLVFDSNTGMLLTEAIYDANGYKAIITGSLYPQPIVMNYGVSLGDHYSLRAVSVDPGFDMTNYSTFATGDAWVLDVVDSPVNVQGQLDFNGGEYLINTDPRTFFNTTYLSGSTYSDDAGLLTPTTVVFQNGTSIGIEKTIKLQFPLLTNLVVGTNELSFDMDTGSYLFNIVVDKNLGIVSSYTMTDSLALHAHFQLDLPPQAIQLNYGVTTGDKFSFNASRLDPGFDMSGIEDVFTQFDQFDLEVLAVPASVEALYHSNPDSLEFTDVNTYFTMTYPNSTTTNSLSAIYKWALPTYGLLVNNSALGIVDFAKLLGSPMTIYTTPVSVLAYYNMNNYNVFADYNITNGVLQVLNITDASGFVATITLVPNNQETTTPPPDNTNPTDPSTSSPPETTSTRSTTSDVNSPTTSTSEVNSPPEQNNSSSEPALPLPIGFAPILIGLITGVILLRRKKKLLKVKPVQS